MRLPSNMWFRPALLAGLWLALVVLGVAGHLSTSVTGLPTSGGEPGRVESAIRDVARAFDALAAPGWAIVRWFGIDGLGPTVAAVAAHGGVWAAALAAALALRTHLRRASQRRHETHAVAPPPHGSERDETPGRWIAWNGGAAIIGSGGAGSLARTTLLDPWLLALRRYRVPIRDLPASLEGLRLVQVTDTHLGSCVPTALVRDTVRQAMALRPDLVVLTGDYIHRRREDIATAAEVLAPLTRAPLGAVGVLGNHDWWAGGHDVAAAMRAVGVRMIDNGRVFVSPLDGKIVDSEPRDPALCLAGLGDLEEHGVDFDAALGGIRPATPRLLLSHNPDAAEHRWLRDGADDAASRVDLMLSGHTHGGQVSLPWLGPLVVPSAYGGKYAGGLVRGPTCRVLVSRGVGMSLLPVRVNCPPEIVEITLTRA